MRYNRKLKGAQYQYRSLGLAENWMLKTDLGVSKGKFTRQIISPIEGNQGPYPLQGSNNETFIIVLAGSERVYIDGVLLTRGEDEDYVMDYNLSEITFSRKILINARQRITIEFNYVEFNYQKSVNTVEIDYSKNKLSSFIHLFRENDSKSVTGDLLLAPEDLQALAAAGDQVSQFSVSGVREFDEAYNPNLIYYRIIDTVVGQVQYNDVLVWTTDPIAARYTVQFSLTGEGKGDYRISTNPSPNGRVYEWIAPDPVSGKRFGNYDPNIPLTAPQKTIFEPGRAV